jgi:hypothetical protein
MIGIILVSGDDPLDTDPPRALRWLLDGQLKKTAALNASTTAWKHAIVV